MSENTFCFDDLPHSTLNKRLHVILFESSDLRDTFFMEYYTNHDKKPNLKKFLHCVNLGHIPKKQIVAITSLDQGLVTKEIVKNINKFILFLQQNKDVHIICSVDYSTAYNALNNAILQQKFPIEDVQIDYYSIDPNTQKIICTAMSGDEFGFDGYPFIDVAEEIYEEKLNLINQFNKTPK